MKIKDFFKRRYKKIMLLTFVLFLISLIVPVYTKIQSYYGLPLFFYAEGVFPWIGDLESKTLFFLPELVFDIIFWFLISSLIIVIYDAKTKIQKRS